VKDPSTGNTVKNITKFRSNIVPCTEGRIGIKDNKPDYLGLRSRYMCPEKVDY